MGKTQLSCIDIEQRKEKIMVNRRSVFLEARKTAGRTGKRISLMEQIEEKERGSRVSRMTSKMASKEFESELETKGLDFDIDNLAREFPMETLFLSQAGDEKRLDEYKKFREMSRLWSKLKKKSANLKNKKIQPDAELIRTMYKIYPEECNIPKWMKKGMSRIHHDGNFQNYARDYWEEMGEDAEVVDFDDLDEDAREEQRRRRSCMVGAYTADPSDDAPVKSLDMNVDTRDTQRAGQSVQQKALQDSRRASMMVMTDMKKMAQKDSRRTSFADGTKAGSHRTSFAKAAMTVLGSIKFEHSKHA